MKIQDIMGRGNPNEYEVLVNGRWVRAYCHHVSYNSSRVPAAMWGDYYQTDGEATFYEIRVVTKGPSEVTRDPIVVKAGEVPRRVRLPLEGRNLTVDEVDRYAGEAAHTIAIGVAELNAMARTAKAGFAADAELEKLRAQLKSVQEDRDAYKKQALERAEVLAEIGDELGKTELSERGTKYIETIKRVDAARRNAEAGYNLMKGHLKERTDQNQQHVVERGNFKRAVAIALGMVWLSPTNEPTEEMVREKARATRPPLFITRQPSSYQREIDELKKILERSDKFAAEAVATNVKLQGEVNELNKELRAWEDRFQAADRALRSRT